MSGELVTIASLNTRGIPLTGSRLAERYAAIGAGFDAGDADVVCCQEVFTYWHLRRLARPELCVINTHPVANHDGDWSEANRFYPLHRAELAVLARVVNEAGPGAVVCGDFNVARESPLFGEFMAATGLADAFGGACPPTFRAEYLPAGATPHCIDFILTAGGVTAESAALVFAEKKEPLGYVSDHIGLRARLSLTASTPGRGRFVRP